MTPIKILLREVRLEHGLTQVELAEESGVPQPTISQIETKPTQRSIDFSVLERLARALGVEPGALIIRTKTKRR